MPNLSVSEAGTLFATWYDESPRTAASCQPSSPATLCYQMHSRKSPDNGATWGADETTSDVVSPLPLQGDPGIQPTLRGRLRLRLRDTHQARHFVGGRA